MSWMARAGQRWKLWVGIVGLMPSLVSFFLGWRLYALCDGPAYAYCRSADQATAYMMIGTSVGLLAFAWMCLAPRCPACGKRIVWWALSSKPAGGWVQALKALRACPGCGDALVRSPSSPPP
jgi:hypothetical protein